MYKVLIADDEKIICRGLAGLVSQHSELQVVAFAEDGEIAFQKAKEIQPDLMLVDINMPFLNGLEFIYKIRQVLPEAIIIVVTGYDDFSFAQKALELGVMEYLLKPIMEDSFFAALDKAVNLLKKREESKKYLNWLMEQVEQNRLVVLNNFFDNWLHSKMSVAEIEEQMNYLKIQVPSPYWFTIMHLHKDYSREDVSLDNEENDNLLQTEWHEIIQQCFVPYPETTFFQTEDRNLAVISKVLSQNQWEEVIQNINARVEKELGAKLELIQRQGSSLEEIPEIYKELTKKCKEKRLYSAVVAQTLDIVDNQWGNSELSLQSVADALFVSVPYLSRLFSKETGENFASYLTRKRLQEAMWLLKNTNLKMYEIAQKTGYTTQHYFSSTFKKALGVSPADYRKNAIKEEI